MIGIGATITIGLLVAVVLVMFAIKVPIQFAMWEAFAPELKSADPATRRTARIRLIFVLVVAAVLFAWIVIYEPINTSRR